MTSIKLSERGLLSLNAYPVRKGMPEHLPNTRKSEPLLAALNGVFELAARSPDIGSVLPLIADRVMEALDADAAFLFILDEASGELLLEVGRGVPQECAAARRRTPISRGFNGDAVKTGKPVVVDNGAQDPLLGELMAAQGIGPEVIVPLRSLEKVMGTLCVARRSHRRFFVSEKAFLSAVGNTIGVALGNASLRQEMRHTLAQLRQSEEKYRNLFEKAYDAIWVHDLQGNTLDANEACAKLTGYSVEDLRKKNICYMMPPNSQSCLDAVEAALLRNQPVDHRCEGEVVRKDGRTAVIQIATSLISHDGREMGFQHCARDVTDERQLETNLHYYLQQATRAQEEERKRMARELHDEILQKLIIISRQLEKISSSEALWEESIETVRGLRKQIELAVHGLRRFSRDLRPPILDDFGLLPALELLASDLEQQGVATGFKVVGEARRLAPEVEVMLFRIGQEATRNIWRHAQASIAELVIEFIDGRVKLVIKDNGSGFDAPQKVGDLAKLGKLGLVGMQERARLLGGNLTLRSRPGKGTIVTVEVPSTPCSCELSGRLVTPLSIPTNGIGR